MSDLVNKSFSNFNSGDTQVSDTLRQLTNSAGNSNSVLSRLGGV